MIKELEKFRCFANVSARSADCGKSRKREKRRCGASEEQRIAA